MSKVTISDIAEVVGVSPATVSRVLNYDETLIISFDKKKRIFEVAEEFKYVIPKRKKRKKKYKIGLFCSYSPEEELEDTYYLTIRIAIEKRLKDEKITLVRLEELSAYEGKRELDGIIALGTFDEKHTEQFMKVDTPIVCVDYEGHEEIFDSVVTNFERATEKAMHYLFELGHRKIAFVGGIDYNSNNEKVINLREITYERFMSEHQNLSGLMMLGKFTPEYGYVATRELLQQEAKPTAILVANDSMAVGCYKAIYEKGLRIPEDISIIGFNDITSAEYMYPPLTTIRLHAEFLGENAVELMLDRLNTNRTICKKVVIPATLIKRDSCSVVKSTEMIDLYD